MTPKDVLVEARRLIAEVGWTQGAYARRGGIKTSPADKHADCYCARGAVLAAGSSTYKLRALALLRAASGKTVSHSLPVWNDEPLRTKEDVLEAFDRAIEMASEEQVRVHCLVCGSSWAKGDEPVHDPFCRISTLKPETIEGALVEHLKKAEGHE